MIKNDIYATTYTTYLRSTYFQVILADEIKKETDDKGITVDRNIQLFFNKKHCGCVMKVIAFTGRKLVGKNIELHNIWFENDFQKVN